GCPLCWEFPQGWEPHDFAYLGPHPDKHAPNSRLGRWAASRAGSSAGSRPGSLGGSGTGRASLRSAATGDGGPPATQISMSAGGVLLAGGERDGNPQKPTFHTNLTTEAAISMYRSIQASVIKIFVKVVPCGTATLLAMEKGWSVSYLYDLWRANSVEGNTEEAFMFLPTVQGMWSLDNQNIPETDISLGIHTGNLPLSRYNINTNKSTVTVLCTTFFSRVKTRENITRYLEYELSVGKDARIEIFHHLVGCPTRP
ncbi:unnamed protein product, partial [Discosporangium mesarthrocarpum]